LENRLVVEIGQANGSFQVLTDQWITPELIRKQKLPAIISLQWKDGRLVNLRLNARDVPRTSIEDEYFTLPSRTEDDLGNVPEPSFANEIDLRIMTGPISTEFRQLTQHTLRLKAHLAELNSGSPERILDIAVILRTLMCGTTKNGGRLLFRFAAEISAIPVCYTFSGLELNAPDLPLNDEQTIYLLSGAVGIPTSNLRIETNLDRWLEQIALIAPHKCLKHWELIRKVADTFGAHADDDSTKMLHSFVSPHDNGLNLGVLVPIFREYGNMALEVSMVLIERSRALIDEKTQK
jgi:hypothetical protein